MKQNLLKSITLAVAVLLGASVVWANVPPPPVNQLIFIYDTSYTSFTLADCQNCHFPMVTPPNDTGMEILHHSLIPAADNPTGAVLSCINTTGTLPATFATGCHLLVANAAGGFTISDPTQCLSCHTESPHHTTTFAAAQDCKHCHGAAVDNTLDGHYIPSYPMDTSAGGVTPGEVGRTVANPAVPGTTIIVQGCEACHQADPTATPPIDANMDNHHGTGIGQGAPGSVGTCLWCHGSGTNSFTIRACEACHGENSLHNIQAETPAEGNLGTIVPGAEALGYGHIGNTWDCEGCHWSWTGTATTDTTTATAPYISGMNTHTMVAGQATNLIIDGSSFVNLDTSGTTAYTPVVTLTSCTGAVTTLTPFSTTVSEVQVALPTTLATGVYEVRISKSGTISNLVKLVVAPAPQLTSAVLSGSTLTIAGVGFGTEPSPQFGSLLGVYVNGTQASTVSSWINSRIVVTSPLFTVGGTVTVKTLYGSVAGTIFGAAKKVR